MLQPRIIATAVLLTTFSSVSSVLAQGRLDRPFFFREGQYQLDQQIQQLQQQQNQQQNLEVPSQLLTVNDGQLRWQKFLFRDGGFSIWMPEAIQSHETNVLDTSAGKLSFDVFATQPQSFRFVAAYSNPIDSTHLQNPQTFLDSVRDGIIAKTQFKLISENPNPLQQYPGIQLTMKDGEETITFRVYLINKRVYVLAAGEKKAQEISENVTTFFDSFRLLN